MAFLSDIHNRVKSNFAPLFRHAEKYMKDKHYRMRWSNRMALLCMLACMLAAMSGICVWLFGLLFFPLKLVAYGLFGLAGLSMGLALIVVMAWTFTDAWQE